MTAGCLSGQHGEIGGWAETWSRLKIAYRRDWIHRRIGNAEDGAGGADSLGEGCGFRRCARREHYREHYMGTRT